MNIGEDQPVRCLKNGLWLLKNGSSKFVVLLAPVEQYGLSNCDAVPDRRRQ